MWSFHKAVFLLFRCVWTRLTRKRRQSYRCNLHEIWVDRMRYDVIGTRHGLILLLHVCFSSTQAATFIAVRKLQLTVLNECYQVHVSARQQAGGNGGTKRARFMALNFDLTNRIRISPSVILVHKGDCAEKTVTLWFLTASCSPEAPIHSFSSCTRSRTRVHACMSSPDMHARRFVAVSAHANTSSQTPVHKLLSCQPPILASQRNCCCDRALLSGSMQQNI